MLGHMRWRVNALLRVQSLLRAAVEATREDNSALSPNLTQTFLASCSRAQSPPKTLNSSILLGPSRGQTRVPDSAPLILLNSSLVKLNAAANTDIAASNADTFEATPPLHPE